MPSGLVPGVPLRLTFGEARGRLSIIGGFCKKPVQNKENLSNLKAGTSLVKLENAAQPVGLPTPRGPQGEGARPSCTRVSVLVSDKSPQFNLRHNLRCTIVTALIL